VLVHCGQRPLSSTFLVNVAAAGQYGVQLFFIISAGTISMTYAQHLRRYGANPRSAVAWLVRRLFRIWPLYAIAAVFYAVEKSILRTQLGLTDGPTPNFQDWLTNLTFTNPWIGAGHYLVPGGWSIVVEASFYCVFPILMIWRRLPSFPTLLMILAMLLLSLAEWVAYRSQG